MYRNSVPSVIKQQLEDSLSSDLCPGDRQATLDNLLQFADVFDERLGHTSVIQHTIDTGNSAPIDNTPAACHMLIVLKPGLKCMTCQNRGPVVAHGFPPLS